MFVYVRDELDVFEGELESYITSMNQTGSPVLLQVKELINITKGKTIFHLCSCHFYMEQGGTCDWWWVHTYSNYCFKLNTLYKDRRYIFIEIYDASRYVTLIKKGKQGIPEATGSGEGMLELQLGQRGAGRTEEGQDEQACAPPAAGGIDISPARKVG